MNFQLAKVTCFIVLFSLMCGSTIGQDWTQFRGSDSNGHANNSSTPLEFGENKNLQWKISIPGKAWSSPVIEGNQIWLTNAKAIEATGEEKAEMMKKNRISGMSAYSSVKLFVLCIDAKTGKKLYEKEIFTVQRPPLINTLNSFASPTPVLDKENAYINFGSFGTVCLSRKDFSIVWTCNRYKIDHQTGPGSSPLLAGDRLFINFDGIDKQFVVALDKKDGSEIWKVDRSGKLHDQVDFQKAFTTPLLINQEGRQQLVSIGADWAYGYDPENGKELWKVPFGQLGFSNAPQPLFADNKIIVCTGYMRSQLLAIDFGNGKPSENSIAWKYRQQVPAMPSPIVVKDRVYFVSDKGIATCLAVRDGSMMWQKRLGGDFSASPIFANGHLYFSNRKGEIFVIKPDDAFTLVSENQLDSRVMATPAAAGKSLLIRTEKSLYHFARQ